MNLKINYENREALGITDFEFLLLFKKENEKVYFRLIQEEKHIAEKFDCRLSLNNDLEYPLMQKIFKKYQKQGYGVYFVVNSGGHKKDSIKRINAHFIDMDFGKIPRIKEEKLIRDSEGKIVYEYRTKEEIEKYKIAFLKKLASFKLNPNIIVETKNGFHVYWLIDHDKPQNLDAFTPLQEKLINYFAALEEREEHADKNVKDINRVLRLINYEHLKNPKDPFTIKCIYLNTNVKYTQEDIANAIDCSINELVSSTKYKGKKSPTLKTEINNFPKERHKIHSSSSLQYEDLIAYLRKQDLISYLGIDAKPNVNFKCIFHNDNKPSAVIKNNGGYYKYFCNSPVCISHKNGKGMDIIDIVKIQENCDDSTAIMKLIEHFNIKLKDSTWINEQTKKFEVNMMLLSQLKERKNEFPNLNRIIRFGIPLLMDILQIGKKNIFNRYLSTNGKSIFFFSNRYLAGITNKDVSNINKYINLFCTLGLLNKVPYNEVNHKFRAMAITKANGKNGISFYTVPDYNEAFKTAEIRASIMLKYRFSIKGMSKKYLENCFGKDFANEIYLVNVKYTKRSESIRDAIEMFILEQIKTNGYFTKDMLMNYKLKVDNNYIKKGLKEYEFRRVLPDILQKYDLVYVKANKNINQKLGINTKKYVLIQKELIDK